MLNIWALEKHTSVKYVLLLLVNEFGTNSFKVDIEGNLDNRAVYLQHRAQNSTRAYIFTNGQIKERYGVHLEFPFSASANVFLEAYENLTYSGLKRILTDHLDLWNG